MTAQQERDDPNSCLNRAGHHERLFVLMARDHSAPVAIEAWIKHRLATGKNQPTDQQIKDAQDCVDEMLAYAEVRDQIKPRV